MGSVTSNGLAATAIVNGQQRAKEYADLVGHAALHTARIIAAQRVVTDLTVHMASSFDPRIAIAMELAKASIDVLFKQDPQDVLADVVKKVVVYDGIFETQVVTDLPHTKQGPEPSTKPEMKRTLPLDEVDEAEAAGIREMAESLRPHPSIVPRRAV